MKFKLSIVFLLCAAMVLLYGFGSTAYAQGGATMAPVIGEIQFMTVDDPNDIWSSGTIVVGGQVIIIPRNLLVDLPANRLTLQQIFDEAPAACKAAGESGLARGDACVAGGSGGIATITANRTSAGNVIAGDVFIEKGQETVGGTVTYIDYTDGYFRVNGIPGDATTGVMVRVNDPDGRHTIQQGLGCAGGPNCSPDPRFTNDPDNYTNTFSTGYPFCIPSTVARAGSSGSDASGNGDALCPDGNRSGNPVADSTRFAPLQVGDPVTADGNFETVNGVHFLSAHTVLVGLALTTQDSPSQPDYFIFDEVEIDVPGFENERTRGLFIGFTTRSPAQVDLWSIHYDPSNNEGHEFPLGSTVNNPLTVNQGLVTGGSDIFKIRYDVDFLAGAPVEPRLSPCTNLRNAGYNVCPFGGTMEEEFGILSPAPHEIIGRTRHKQAFPGLTVLDVNGNEAPWGEYLFPLGVGLGGIAFPEFGEIDLNKINTPHIFSGLPWLLDRRLSPNGCDGSCEGSRQPLDPFPFSGLDPRTQANVPAGPYSDPIFTQSTLTSAVNRILSYVNSSGHFDGNNTVLPWPPQNPGFLGLAVTPDPIQICSIAHLPPVAVDDTATTNGTDPVGIDVTANDVTAQGATLDLTTLTVVGGPSLGSTTVNTTTGIITYTPGINFVDTDVFTYTVADSQGATSNQATVTISLSAANNPPVAADDVSTSDLVINVIANDIDSDGTIDPASVVIVTQPLSGTVTVNGDGTVTYTPGPAYNGSDSFTYTVADNNGAVSNIATVTIAFSGSGPGNAAPTVSISAPANGASFTTGDSISFTGSASDAEDGDLSGSLSWSSSLDGNIGSGGSFSISSLSAGTHLITASVTDSGGESGSASVAITVADPVNTAPTVSISAPTDGASFTEGDPVTFTGSASDAEDGDLSGSLSWSSSIDGNIGSSGSFLINTLSVGTHQITASVTDSGGESGSATITITIAAATDTLTVTRAQFRPANGRWRVAGTSSIAGPGNTITIYVGPTVGGTVIGTAEVDTAGAWLFDQIGSAVAPDGTNTISLASSQGGTLEAVPITLR